MKNGLFVEKYSKKSEFSERAVMNKKEKDKALQEALDKIKKNFGEGAVIKMDDKHVVKVDSISTGSISLDMATGIGGVPKGRIVEIYGEESTGKSTLALSIVAECQKKGGKAAYIDAEHALDPTYAEAIGVNLEELYISQPDNGEEALEICDMLAQSKALDVIIIDSVAALVPKAELQGEMGDSHVGLQARLMSQALRKITAAVDKSKVCVVFINQLREKVGVVYGSPKVTTGGKSLKFYASMRFETSRIETLKVGDKMIGSRTRVKIVKNKCAPPFRTAEFDVLYGEGISKEGDVLDVATNLGIVQKAGAWYSYNGNKIGQGRDNAKKYIVENNLVDEIREKIVGH